MSQWWMIVFVLLSTLPMATPSFAASKRPGNRRDKQNSGGGGFGSSAPRPQVAKQKRKAAVGAPRTEGLELKLEEQHAENCAKAAQLWATCKADATPAYDSGWEAYPAPDAGVSPGNAPYGTERLLLKSRAPLLSAATCQSLIDQMEAHGAANGWDSRYPVTGFTREVNVADIPESVELLNGALESTLLPAAAAEFDAIHASDLRVNEALVVKYDAASGHNCLPGTVLILLYALTVPCTAFPALVPLYPPCAPPSPSSALSGGQSIRTSAC